MFKPTIRLVTYPDRASWLKAREGRLNASEVAVLFDVSPYDSPHSLYLKKRGLRDDYDPAWVERMDIASAMEPVVAAIFERKTGLESIHLGDLTIATNDAYPILGATLDRVVVVDGWACPLELKAPGSYKAKDWDEEVPLEFQIQATAQMMAIGAERACVAAIIGGTTFRYQWLTRNEALCESIARRAAEFMDAVARGEAPEVDGSPHTTAALKALHPEHKPGAVVDLPEEAGFWFDELESIGAQVKALEEARARVENHVRAALGDAEVGRGPGVEFSYKAQGGAAQCVQVPLEYQQVLAKAGIPGEVKHSPRFRVLRKKRVKN